MLKYSRQRECIKQYLSSSKEHPTADMVYTHVRKEFPNISLGTVYRNLTLLVDIGEAMKVDVGDNLDHFDAYTEPHYHIICDTCGCVEDVFLPVEDKMVKDAASYYNGEVLSQTVYFHGTCSNCLKKLNKDNKV